MDIELNDLKRKIDLINSEGPLLSLFFDSKKNLILEGKSSETKESIFFKANIQDIKMYINSFISLNDLFNSRTCFVLKEKNENKVKSYLSKEYSCSLLFGNLFYDEIEKSMKPFFGLDEFYFDYQ
jgi:hypothetical protein